MNAALQVLREARLGFWLLAMSVTHRLFGWRAPYYWVLERAVDANESVEEAKGETK